MSSVSASRGRSQVISDSREAALKVGVKVEVILKIVAEIKAVLKIAIEEVKLMVKLELDDILCGSDGTKIGVTVIAGLCVQLMLVGKVNLFPATLADVFVIAAHLQSLHLRPCRRLG